ncbi:MAG: hypothetical protein NVSMB52_10540 [Chloroflexota bacterium]
MVDAIVVNPKDNVATATREIKAGETVTFNGGHTTIPHSIRQGHKFSLSTIERGAFIVKYGYPVGVAIKSIPTGHHVHGHNMGDMLPEKRGGSA